MLKGMLAVLAVCFAMAGQVWADSPYFQVKVNQGDGSYAEALCWPDHLADTSWTQEADYLDRPQVVLDGSGTKYGTLGPDAGSWTLYVWTGSHVVQDTPYEVSATAFSPSHVVISKYDGTILSDVVMTTQETMSWIFYATPATTAQWRTKGYRLEVTAVPEPTSLVGFSMLLSGVVVFRRKLR